VTVVASPSQKALLMYPYVSYGKLSVLVPHSFHALLNNLQVKSDRCLIFASLIFAKRYILVHKNSLASYQRCSHSVEPRALTCEHCLIFANSCVLKHLFLQKSEQPKISPKNPGNALSDALLMSRFQTFAADAAKKNRTPHSFLKPRFAWF